YEKITQRDAEIAPLREENARLKGLKGRPHCLHPRAQSVGDGDHSPRSPHRKEFCRSSAWMARLKELGITALKVNPDPVRISTEGAIRGSIATQGLLDGSHRLRWCRPVRHLPPTPVLDPCRAPCTQARCLHRGAAPSQRGHPGPQLETLCRSQGLSLKAHSQAQG